MTKKQNIWSIILSLFLLLLFFVLDDTSVVFLGYATVTVSIFTLVFGLVKREWVFILISSLMSIPMVYYFQFYQLKSFMVLWLIPFLLLFIAFMFLQNKRKYSEQ